MGFFGMVLKPGQKEAVEVPEGWNLQLCSAALEYKAAGELATLWLEVEGEIGNTSYLLGTLQGNGACAQMSLTHCLDSVDGEVVVEAKGKGVVHLTGYFVPDEDYSRGMDVDMSDSDDSEGNYGPGMACAYTDDSDDEDAESSDDDEQDARIELSSADGVEGELMTKGAKKSGWDKNGHRKSNGRAMRSAAAAAMLLSGSGAADEDNSEDDSEVDSEYVPGDELSDEDNDGGSHEDSEDDEEEEEEQEEKSKNKQNTGQQKKDVEEKQARTKRSAAAAVADADATADATMDVDTSAPAAKKARSLEKKAKGEDGEKEEGGEEKGIADESAMSKSERKRQRKKENKRKAAEAKRVLEEAFRSMNDDEKGEPPIGVPLKSPRTKTLKGGLKIKDTTLGGGKMAVPGKNVKILYEGCFPDGRIFDSAQNKRKPLQFRVGMQNVIVGMDRGVEGMRIGGSREIAIPAALGYGSRGTGPIPPNQDLVFRVELLDVLGK